MHLLVRCSLVLCNAMCLLVCAATASAQTIGYVGGTAFADIRQFGSTITRGQSRPEESSRDATGAGGSLRVGTWIHPRWTLEVGADLTSKTTMATTGPVIAIYPPVPPLELKFSTSFASVTTMVGFHSPAGRRVRLGYRAGFSFVRSTYTTEYQGFPGLSIFDTGDGFGVGLVELEFVSGPVTTRPPRMSSPVTVTTKRNSGALALGIEAAIDVTSKIAVVPELRASTFATANSGAGVFLIRPGVGVRWNF